MIMFVLAQTVMIAYIMPMTAYINVQNLGFMCGLYTM